MGKCQICYVEREGRSKSEETKKTYVKYGGISDDCKKQLVLSISVKAIDDECNGGGSVSFFGKSWDPKFGDRGSFNPFRVSSKSESLQGQ